LHGEIEHPFEREHSTGVPILGSRCDSSAVASARRVEAVG
jgi:hypothetical protein